MKKVTVILIAAVLLIAAVMSVSVNRSAQNDENEIKLKIQLDLEEDIGLFIIDSDISGNRESGGVSNADRSMLKRDDVIYWSIDRQHYEGISDTVELKLHFTVVTEYCDPNYENIYPEEYMIPIDDICFSAEFGKEYGIRVTGDKANGYKAVLEQAPSMMGFVACYDAYMRRGTSMFCNIEGAAHQLCVCIA